MPAINSSTPSPVIPVQAPVHAVAAVPHPAHVDNAYGITCGDVGRCAAKVAAGTLVAFAGAVAVEAFRVSSPAGGMVATVLLTGAAACQMASCIGVPVRGWME